MMSKKSFAGLVILVTAILVLVGGMISGCGSGGTSTPTTTSTTTTMQRLWTIMVYACGDNDLQESIFANINEMEKTGSTGEVAMVAQTDWWNYSGSAESIGAGEATGEGVARWYILKDSDMSKIKSQLVTGMVEINTGTAEAIKDFAVWGIQNYPATHYMLVLSSHGGGWKSKNVIDQGVGQDFTSDPTHGLLVTLPDLKRVLPDIYTAAGNKKLDILALDSCNNGALEFAYQVKDYFDLMVASEQTIPGTGFPYDTLTADLVANPAMTAEAFAKTIVNRYYAYYTDPSNIRQTTLAAIDLSKITAVANEVKNLKDLYDTTTKQTILRDVIDCHTDAYKYMVQRYYSVTFRDLWDMADKIIGSSEGYDAITLECSALKTAIEQAVLLSKYTSGASDQYSITGSHGLSIYFSTAGTYAYDTDYDSLDFSTYTGWGTFLKDKFQ